MNIKCTMRGRTSVFLFVCREEMSECGVIHLFPVILNLDTRWNDQPYLHRTTLA